MEGDWETANAFYPGVDSTACLDGSEPIAIQCRVHETQVAWDLVSYHDVLRCLAPCFCTWWQCFGSERQPHRQSGAS